MRIAAFLLAVTAVFTLLLIWSWVAFVTALLLAAALRPTDAYYDRLGRWLTGDDSVVR